MTSSVLPRYEARTAVVLARAVGRHRAQQGRRPSYDLVAQRYEGDARQSHSGLNHYHMTPGSFARPVCTVPLYAPGISQARRSNCLRPPAAVKHGRDCASDHDTVSDVVWRPEQNVADSTAVQGGPSAWAATPLVTAEVKPELSPNQAEYDPTDEQLREAAGLLQQALNTSDVKVEEELFTRVIDQYGDSDAKWKADVVGRALGNRGNARSRQGRLDEALSDYNQSIELCPWSVDPVLNRGVVLEAQGRFDEAVKDYRTVLAAEPEDPSAWNNLGNASAGLQKWNDAAEYYGKAAALAPAFSFAAANKALAMYQLGEKDPKTTDEALREMRALLRKYPDFPDVRAALAAALWGKGEGGEAESNWLRVDDPRYRDRAWLSSTRRWPPRLVANLVAFLDVQSAPQSISGS